MVQFPFCHPATLAVNIVSASTLLSQHLRKPNAYRVLQQALRLIVLFLTTSKGADAGKQPLAVNLRYSCDYSHIKFLS
jgi:hypothetical protein